MKYYVHINSVYTYEGRSHDKALEAFQVAINVMRSVKGTGSIWYKNADSMGERRFVNGEEQE